MFWHANLVLLKGSLPFSRTHYICRFSTSAHHTLHSGRESAIQWPLDVRACAVSLDLATERYIIELALGILLISEAFAYASVIQAQLSACHVVACGLLVDGFVVLSDVFRDPAYDAGRQWIVDIGGRVSWNDRCRYVEVVELARTARGSVLADGERAAFSVCAGEAEGTAGFEVALARNGQIWLWSTSTLGWYSAASAWSNAQWILTLSELQRARGSNASKDWKQEGLHGVLFVVGGVVKRWMGRISCSLGV